MTLIKMSAGTRDSNPTMLKVSGSNQEEDTVSAPISLYFHTMGVPAHTITLSDLYTSSEISKTADLWFQMIRVSPRTLNGCSI